MQIAKSTREFGYRCCRWIRQNMLAATLLTIGMLGLLSIANHLESAPAQTLTPPPHSHPLATPYQHWAEHPAERERSLPPAWTDRISDPGDGKP